ncbi:hypothetical protein B0J17DRAFT_723420 [Rhizoctonia solani]|nr:hypothetical protein B0J17DRAFT_723420 [Rhizoctonia solani]
MRSTPVTSLDAHLDLLPMHLLMNEACQRAAIRLAATNPSHPLHKAVAKCASGRKKFPPPLQNILRFAEVRPTDFEHWPFNRQPLPSTSPESFPDQHTATISAWSDTAHLQVYTDAAAGRAGVAAVAAVAVLWETGGWELRTGLRLGEPGSHSVLDAEIAGILMAAHLVILAQEDTIIDDGASLQLLKATRRVIRLVKKGSGGTPIRLQWCPGHEGVPGNEAADEEASRAASGHTYPPHLIPRFLTEYRPATNPTTRKKALMAANRLLAEAHWTESDAHAKYPAKYPNLSPRHFLAHSRALTRSKATLLFRLTSGHVQLRQHLYRRQLVDSPRCEQCGRESESVTHFLFRCPHYAAQRLEHLARRGTDFLRPAFLLHASCALQPLFDFVIATGRFADRVR